MNIGQVHERSVDGDFLLLELKELQKRNPRLKVILMSATINEETFIEYFDDAPLLRIPGFAYPVTDRFVKLCYLQHAFTLRHSQILGGRDSFHHVPPFGRQAVEEGK